MYILLFFVGLAASAQSLSFGIVNDINLPKYVGTAMGFNNMAVVAGGLGTRHIRNLVQFCFDQAEMKLRQAGMNDEAEDLRAATVHWLRHTAITADIEFRPREHVRDDVGHENPATTERYIDTDRIARHHSAKHKTLHPESEDSKRKADDS